MIQKIYILESLSKREVLSGRKSFLREVPKCKFHFPLSLGKKEGIKDLGKEERSFTFWN